MKPNADSLTSGGSIELGSTSSGRVFQSFRCWPLVPMPDFLPLRLALEQDMNVTGSASVQEVLRLVDAEISRRSGLPAAKFDAHRARPAPSQEDQRRPTG